MTRKLICLLALLSLFGCASTIIPTYVVDKYPYKKTFLAGFDETLQATKDTFKEFGWTIARETHPSEYERGAAGQEQARQILLLTEIRQTSLFIGTRYLRLNVYLRETQDKTAEMEIRYLAVNAFFFKTFYHYKNDKLAERIFTHIQQSLDNPSP